MNRAAILLCAVACVACGDDAMSGPDAAIDSPEPRAVHFAPQAMYVAGGPFPTEVVVRDLDGDGFPDLAVVDNQSSNFATLHNNGDATFAPAVAYDTAIYPITIEVGDVDSDGRPDVVTSNGMHFNLGGGAFGGETSYGPPSVAARLADLNADGKLDIVIMHPGAATVTVLLGIGGGAFAAGVSYPTPIYTAALMIADVNKDGNQDVIVSVDGNTATPGHSIAVLLGTGTGTFGAFQETELVLRNPTYFALGDLDGDGKLDLVASSYRVAAFVVSRGRGDGTFEAPRMQTLSAAWNPVVIADINGDMAPDVVLAHGRSASVGVFLNFGDGTLAPESTFMTGNEPQFVTSSDINKDGLIDLVVANRSSGSISVLLQQP